MAIRYTIGVVKSVDDTRTLKMQNRKMQDWKMRWWN